MVTVMTTRFIIQHQLMGILRDRPLKLRTPLQSQRCIKTVVLPRILIDIHQGVIGERMKHMRMTQEVVLLSHRLLHQVIDSVITTRISPLMNLYRVEVILRRQADHHELTPRQPGRILERHRLLEPEIRYLPNILKA